MTSLGLGDWRLGVLGFSVWTLIAHVVAVRKVGQLSRETIMFPEGGVARDNLPCWPGRRLGDGSMGSPARDQAPSQALGTRPSSVGLELSWDGPWERVQSGGHAGEAWTVTPGDT